MLHMIESEVKEVRFVPQKYCENHRKYERGEIYASEMYRIEGYMKEMKICLQNATKLNGM